MSMNTKNTDDNIVNTDNISKYMDDNSETEREQFEFQKYGRRLHQEAAAHAHFYTKHSIEPAYGFYDRPASEVI